MSEKIATHWLEREDLGELTVVRFRASRLLDDDDTRDAFDQLYSLVEDAGRTSLLLNFGAVEYVSSLGLGKLVMLNRKVQVAEGWLGLCRLSPAVRDIFEITHLINLFFVYSDEGHAVEAFEVQKS
jgi:anti-sigma B factor antagonist